MDKDKLQEVLRLHGLWLSGDPAGAQANLSGADLSQAGKALILAAVAYLEATA